MAAGRDCVVAISDAGRPPVKVVRLNIGRDGSISVMVPYHPEPRGLLVRTKDRELRDHAGRPGADTVEEYLVDVPVKLSLHPSGFVQFSSAGRRAIRSGATKPFHIPKGMGLHSHPFTDPSDTGPTFGVGFSDIAVCPKLDPKERRTPVLLFEEADFFERQDHDPATRHA